MIDLYRDKDKDICLDLHIGKLEVCSVLFGPFMLLVYWGERRIFKVVIG